MKKLRFSETKSIFFLQAEVGAETLNAVLYGFSAHAPFITTQGIFTVFIRKVNYESGSPTVIYS